MREAKKRAPEVVRSAISVSEIKGAKKSGKIMTLGEIFHRAVQDP
jgi:hypothetical protein